MLQITKEGPPDTDDSHFDSAPATTTDVGGLKKLPIAYALGFRRQASKLHLELRQRRVSQQTKKMMSQRETHLAEHRPQSRELYSRSVSTPTPNCGTILKPTKLPKIKKSLATRKVESRDTFCHADREAIVNMMERHYCAHLMICGTRS